MKNTKKNTICSRIALFFAVFLFLSAVPAVCAPAASFQMNWHTGEPETSISVEIGAKFYIGDFVSILSDRTSATASLVRASYKIKDKKIASVNGKGYLTARKEGQTDLTVTYQKKTVLCHLTVEKKKTFGEGREIKELQAAAQRLSSGMPKKVTVSNGYQLEAKRKAYLISYGATSALKLSYDGFLNERERPIPMHLGNKRSVKLAAPEAGRFLTVRAMLRQFLLDNNPASTNSKKAMKISSASASSKTGTFTIRLAKALTADQIFAAQMAFPEENIENTSREKAEIILSVYDVTAEKYYKGFIWLKKGSRQLEVRPMAYRYEGYQQVDLAKGNAYLLGSELNWAKGRKVVAK